LRSHFETEEETGNERKERDGRDKRKHPPENKFLVTTLITNVTSQKYGHHTAMGL